MIPTPDQAALLRGRRYNRLKKARGAPPGNKYAAKQSGQNVHSVKTAQRLARQHGVDEKTIRRDGQFAGAVEKTRSLDPDIERKVVSGKGPPKAAVTNCAALACPLWAYRPGIRRHGKGQETHVVTANCPARLPLTPGGRRGTVKVL